MRMMITIIPLINYNDTDYIIADGNRCKRELLPFAASPKVPAAAAVLTR